ncbi:ribosomal L1 domain-containing protein 1-like [Ornithodoros turicata]|uniref:ribosomal L1 domain-containing protein 1-like n=1 Tax=Ornithodoros turicata TaxID=34597 RepID=UPI0031387046
MTKSTKRGNALGNAWKRGNLATFSVKMAAHVHVEKVAEALRTLRSVAKRYQVKDAKNLLIDSSDDNLYLQLTLKKIPYNTNAKLIKIDLPYTLASEDTDICLFVGDLEKKNPRAENEKTVDYYKELLQEAGVTRNIDIIPLRQLRTEYQPYEAKRNLCAGYDVFLTDQLIYPIIARYLGKTFYVKNKLPRRVDTKKSNLKSHLEHVLSTTYLMLRCEGTASTVLTAHLGMKDAQAVENVRAVCDVLEKKLPGGWDNILSLHVKTHKSVALPLYMSFDSRNKVFVEAPPKKKEVLQDDISTVPGGKVSVSLLGKLRLKADKDQEMDEEGEKIFAELMDMQAEEEKGENYLKHQKMMSRKALLGSAFRNPREKRQLKGGEKVVHKRRRK